MTAKKYNVKFLFNGLKFEKRTDDIEEAIKEVAPAVLLTEMYVIAHKTGEKHNLVERKVNLIQAKRVFRDDITRKVFVMNLMLA